MTINQQAIEQLKAAGFQDTLPKAPERTVAKIAGLEKRGKTHLALTSPEPIIFFSIDKGTEGVVEKFIDAGKQVLVYEIRYQPGDTKEIYKPIWKAFRDRLDMALLVGEGTIVIDTWNEIYELIRYATWGKINQVPTFQYPQVYPDLRMIIDDVYNTKMSAVLLNRMRKAFDPPHELEEYGYSETSVKVQTNIRTTRDMVPSTETGLMEPVFSFNVLECRQNMKLAGLTFSSKEVQEDGSILDKFDMSDFNWLVHNWK